ncbi:hypothetical protein Chor_004412 [Crotalus horridus]
MATDLEPAAGQLEAEEDEEQLLIRTHSFTYILGGNIQGFKRFWAVVGFVKLVQQIPVVARWCFGCECMVQN